MRVPWAGPIALAVAGCVGGSASKAPPPTGERPVPVAAPGAAPAVLGPDGQCQGAAPAIAAAIAPGIGECELVRLEGRTPDDVLLGESGRGGREVQVLYAEPTGRELYLFVNNRLDRIVK